MPVIHVPDVPYKLSRSLVADAKKRDMSVGVVAAEILSVAYKVPWKVGRTAWRPAEANLLMLRVPERLRTRVRMDAARSGSTIRGLVIEKLSEHYGVKAESPRRRGRPRRGPRAKE